MQQKTINPLKWLDQLGFAQAKLEQDSRIVTFANGMVVCELASMHRTSRSRSRKG
jgi:hypothetical protein